MGILNSDIPLAQLRINDDRFPTETSIAQKRTEDSILDEFLPYAANNIYKKPLEEVRLQREKHAAYLKRGLEHLSRWATALDASKPWLMFWILHSLDLLEVKVSDDIITRGIASISKWKHPDGGYGGGPGQLAHLATTYAAVNALAILGTKEAYDSIDRNSLYKFLLSMKQPDGSFTMHDGGEIDIRGSYCALSVASLTNLLTPELTRNCVDFIRRTQTYEGGLGPCPGKEAHNGYTFCGLAAIEILGGMPQLNMDKLIKWCTGRQMRLEGGFQGRTNKLVDGCYSFWGAGDFPLIQAELQRSAKGNVSQDYLLDREALQEYILLCCQSGFGGLIDKPGKNADYYHTCYCLSGLSTVQHYVKYDIEKAKRIRERGLDPSFGGIGSLLWTCTNELVIVGDLENAVAAIHPIYNLTLNKARAIIHHFYQAEISSIRDLLPTDEEPDDAENDQE